MSNCCASSLWTPTDSISMQIYILHCFAIHCLSLSILSQLAHRHCSFRDQLGWKARCYFCCLTWQSLDDNNKLLWAKRWCKEDFLTGVGIGQNPDPRWRITAKTQQENPQRNKYHVIRRTNDIFKSATQYNNKSKLCGNHEQKPEFSRYGEPVRVNAIFEVSTNAK